MANNSESYPMISKTSWWALRDKFKSSIPSNVSDTYVMTVLNMANPSSASSNVITPMRQLGLIDENGNPTDLAKMWRMDDQYKDACDAMIKSVYPDELSQLFPTSEFDKKQVSTWFMSSTGAGSAASDKMATLFILLKNGTVETNFNKRSNHNSDKTARKASSAKSFARKNEGNPNKPATELEASANESKNNANIPVVHIDLQIHISPESSPEQIEAIFSSMSKHLYNHQERS